MCGIAGWFDLDGSAGDPPDEARRRNASAALGRRGPDGEGTFVTDDGRAGLLHRRLAIVDVAGGAQPMAGPAPGEMLAWNGEVFDHAARRGELESGGASFRTRSDTEVLAHLLSRDGVNALDGVRGQFALAWLAGDSLLLARDPAGEKPLYYVQTGARIRFASTLDALRALTPLDDALDPEALSLYLSWGFVPAPLTILRGVRKLRAGEWLIAERGNGVRAGRVAPPPAVETPAPGDEVARLRAALTEAATLRLESADVPVGVFLSGGLDSLAVTSVLRNAPSLRTFTVRARDASLDESEDAVRVAKALGVEHQVIEPPPDEPDLFRHVFLRHGEPFGTPSSVAVDAVARAAREHVKVALTGDGGDEALGGYPRHVLLRRLARVPRLAGASVRGIGRLRRLKRAAELVALDGADRYAAMYEVFGPWRRDLTPEDDGGAARRRVRELWSGADAGDLDAMLRVDRALELADSHCVKIDVACLENGIEARSPWLDRAVVGLCDSLPLRSRIRGGATKRILREMLAEDLPAPLVREVLRRPKRGFTTGIEGVLRSDGVRSLLLDGPLARVPGIRTAAVERILDEHARRRGNHVFRLTVLVGLAVYADAHVS